MQAGVTITAERNEVFVDIPSAVAPEQQVMNFQIPHATADLASPTIPDQNAQTQSLRKLRISLQLQTLAVVHGSFLFV
jgi:hypothetical protein